MPFDDIWLAEYAISNVLSEVTDRIMPEKVSGVLAGAWKAVECDGKRYGMPRILDMKSLFYNVDILAKAEISVPPTTWGELAELAKTIKDKGIFDNPIDWISAQAEAVILSRTFCPLSTMGAAGRAEVLL